MPEKADDFVGKLVLDPAKPSEFMVLQGFSGKSSLQGQTRLYLTLDLSEYVEVADGDVVHSQSLATDQNPLGGTMLWVKTDARLLHTRTRAAKSRADFLQGDIADKFLRDAGPQAFRMSAQASAIYTRWAFCTQSCSPDGHGTPDCPR